MLLSRRLRSLTRFSCVNTQRRQVAPAVLSCVAPLTSNHDHRSSGQSHAFSWGCGVAGLLAGAGAVFAFGLHKHKAEQAASSARSSLPIFSQEEVSKHCSVENGVWVTYQGSVYDITEFVTLHPGGDKILMAAGGALEPFWAIYAIHNQDHVLEILTEYKIGELSHEDLKKQLATGSVDPYSSDPVRHPVLRVHNLKPFNAEAPTEILTDSYITPNAFFFKRNHLPVPQVNLGSYQLHIEGLPGRELKLTLEELKTKFPKHTINATLHCAGNRRSEMNKTKETQGLKWGVGAIGNAQWSGARLRDVLLAAGFRPDDERWAHHIHFEGLDKDVMGTPYAASIPLLKAFSEQGDVLLAYEMNGEDIPPDHGFPVRAVVPGVVGARSVKWVGKIVVSAEESSSHWQQKDYKGLPPGMDWDTVDFKSAPAIQEMPVQSAITSPTDNTMVHINDGCLLVTGYAWSGGGREVVRVDVSIDGGKTWRVARLKNDTDVSPAPPPGRAWAWKLWELNVAIPSEPGEMEIICKAVDDSYNVQPDTFQPIWNLRGLLGNAWHRVKVKVVRG